MLRNDFKRLSEGKEFIIATDFDDTLVRAKEFPEFSCRTFWFYVLRHIQRNYSNVKVILFTCREGKYLEDAVKFCESHGLTFDAVNEDIPSSIEWKGKTRKPFAHIYVDDRNTGIGEAVTRICREARK